MTHPLHRRTPSSVLALVLVAMLVAAACGDTGSASDADADAGASAEADEGTPQEGGVLIDTTTSYIENLDPHTSPSTATHNTVGIVYSRLLNFATGPGIDYTELVVEPDLAESWDVSDDGLTYTFNLRDDVTWHDVPPVNGRAFVADDVLASMERVQEVGFQRYMLERVVDITAPDDHTVLFTLSEPFAPFINYMANHFMWILPREAQQGLYDPATTVIGTGPFIFEGRQPNVSITWRKNPDYYGEGPYLDGIHRLVMKDEAARIAAFRGGEVNVVSGLPPEQVEVVTQSVDGSRAFEYLSSASVEVMVNEDRPPLDDLRIRQAISLAIDRQGLGEAIYGRGRYTGPVIGSLGKWALPEDELKELLPYDPDRARELLAEAGYPDGLSVGLLTTNGYGAQVMRSAEWVAQDLQAVGIDATIEVAEYATYYGARFPQQQYEIIVALNGVYMEPDEWLRGLRHTDGSRNWFGVSDEELDEMLMDQLTILDEEERVDAVHDIQRYVIENVMNPIPVWLYGSQTVLSGDVRSYHPVMAYGQQHYKDVWLEQ